MSIRKLYINRQVADLPQVKSIQSRIDCESIIISEPKDVFRAVNTAKDPISRAKKILYLTSNQGAFIKKCPGTSNYTCCDYQILHIGTFCNMDCAYCILQSYFHPPVMQFFVNHADMLAELDHIFAQKALNRIGTGEFTDSMIWERWTDLSDLLVTRFGKQNHSILELKTKTTAIEKLKNLKHNRKTIMSWSLNTEVVIKNEERFTTSLDARLKAATRCEQWGYPLAFHFDPMIIYKGCSKDYYLVLKKLFSSISPKNIVWISLGTFRFMPDLKPIIQSRFPDSKIVYGEFITGLDNKMRYFKPLRIKLYKQMVNWIREMAPGVRVYFCMEDDEVWQKTMGFIPENKGGLPHMLDKSAIEHCDLESPF